MANAKIINYGQPISAGSTAIPDNTSEALDIASTDAKDYVTISTDDSNPSIILGKDGAEVGVGVASPDALLHVQDTAISTARPTFNAGTVAIFENDTNCAIQILTKDTGSSIAEINMGGIGEDREGNLRYITSEQKMEVGPRNAGSKMGLYTAGTQRVHINASGNTLIGSSSSPVHLLHVQDGDLGVVTNSADEHAKSLIFTKSRSATDGTAVVVQDDDILGNIEFKGAEDGDSFATGAKIFARVNGTPGDGDMPTELVFETTPDGSETTTTRMTIGANGVIATTADSGGAFTFNRASGNSLAIRLDSNTGLNTSGTEHLEIMHGFKRVADFDGEMLSLQNASSTASGTSGGLWVDLANTCSSSGTGNRTIASTGHKLKVGDAVALPSGNSNAYEVFTVASVTDANTFEVDSDLTNAISSAVGNTDGTKLEVKTGDGAVRFAVAGDGVMTLGTKPGTEDSNIAIGDGDALDTLTTGKSNIILGHASDNYKLTTGKRNIFMGYRAGEDVVSNDNNVMIGFECAQAATNHSNTFIGAEAAKNSTGFENVAIGKSSMTNCTGDRNVAIGVQTLDASGDADNSVAVGFQALSAATGDNNVAIGHSAMSAFTGTDSVAVGLEALDASSSTKSTAVGYQCLTALESGSMEANSGFGYRAGMGLDTGQQCTFLGAEADTTDVDGNNQTAIGYGAVTDSPNQVRVGNTSVADIDGQVALTATSDARVKTNVQDLSLGLDFINALRPVSFSRVHPADWPEEIRDARYKKGQTKTRDILDEDGNVTGTEEFTVSTLTFDVETGQPIKDSFDSTTRSDGLIAQEVKAACETLGVEFNGIKENPNGKMGIQYSLLVAPLIKAVQELTARVAELEGGG